MMTMSKAELVKQYWELVVALFFGCYSLFYSGVMSAFIGKSTQGVIVGAAGSINGLIAAVFFAVLWMHKRTWRCMPDGEEG